jgi:membrane protein implicated in regulation of membrane protease activity
MDWVSFIWAALGILLILSEFFIPGFVIFFFGAGAVITGILTALLPFLGNSILAQVLIWLGTSTLSLLGLRKYLSKVFKGKLIKPKDQEALEAGKDAKVLEKISPDKPGRISFQGTSWEAWTFDEIIKKGSEVHILKQEGMKYWVTAKDLDKSDKDKAIEELDELLSKALKTDPDGTPPTKKPKKEKSE